jgi:hypothetical protein
MATGVTLEEAQALRNSALKALKKAMQSKAVDVGTLKTQRQDLGLLQQQFQYWDRYCQFLMGNGTSIEDRSIRGGVV